VVNVIVFARWCLCVSLMLLDCCILTTGNFLTMWISVCLPVTVTTFNNEESRTVARKPRDVMWCFGFKVCQHHSL